jgi:hypothetical protein
VCERGREKEKQREKETERDRERQVVAYARDSGFAVRIKAGVRINSDGNHNEPLVCRSLQVVAYARDTGYPRCDLKADVAF